MTGQSRVVLGCLVGIDARCAVFGVWAVEGRIRGVFGGWNGWEGCRWIGESARSSGWEMV